MLVTPRVTEDDVVGADPSDPDSGRCLDLQGPLPSSAGPEDCRHTIC